MGNPEPSERSVNYWMLPVVTSGHVFAAIRLDTDALVPNTVVYKDVFSDLAKLEAAVGFGSGDLASLGSVNGFPASAALPAVQQIWIRDTLILDGPGQLNSASNTVVQMVPELSGFVLAGVAIASLATWRARRRPRGSATA